MRTLLFCFLVFVSFIGKTQINYVPQSIRADGVLDESVWETLQLFNGFSNYSPIHGGKAKLDTDVRIFQDGKYLNVAFIYHDSMSEVKINGMKRDKYVSSFHLSDCVGIIIDPYGNQNKGYFFAVNGQGVQLDALIANYNQLNLSWDALWESGTSVHGTDKIYEMKIPLSTFSYGMNTSEWNFQFYTRDAKSINYTVLNQFEGGFFQYDTRFLKPLKIEKLMPSKSARTTLVPAITGSYLKDIVKESENFNLQPSVDIQYKVTDELRLDVTLNPDFSQVEVDQQVTNLTRFRILFPERRTFFTENSDIFTTLGANARITPFNSRFIGASQKILMGLKLSGNVAKNTRIGLLDVQSKKNESNEAQNYMVAVVKQQLGSIFNTKAYLVNRQRMDGFNFTTDYNSVFGGKTAYLSKSRKWSGQVAYSHSLKKEVRNLNSSFYVENKYTTRAMAFGTSFHTVGKNYYTDIGFVPRIVNFDILNKTSIRTSYSQFHQDFRLFYYAKKSKVIERYRPIFTKLDVYWNRKGERLEFNYFYNGAIWFSNNMSVYANFYHDDVHLKYAFDPLRRGVLVSPGRYKNTALRIGWNSNYTSQFYWSFNIQSGSFYDGTRSRFGAVAGYRLLPFLSGEVKYEYNSLNINDLEAIGLHLFGLTAEVFFNNKLNWTTYFQQNEQIDNLNINSRIQWEYKPLSFVYLVYSDNYSTELRRKNWNLSLKVNRRISF